MNEPQRVLRDLKMDEGTKLGLLYAGVALNYLFGDFMVSVAINHMRKAGLEALTKASVDSREEVRNHIENLPEGRIWIGLLSYLAHRKYQRAFSQESER